jgi:hypothetical protein
MMVEEAVVALALALTEPRREVAAEVQQMEQEKMTLPIVLRAFATSEEPAASCRSAEVAASSHRMDSAWDVRSESSSSNVQRRQQEG